MPGEPRTGWTVDTLHEHLDKLLRAFQDHVDGKFRDQEKALEKAAESVKEQSLREHEEAKAWRDAANEWRNAMKDRENQFLQKSEFSTAHRSLEERQEDVKGRVDRLEGSKTGAGLTWGIVLGGLGLIAGAAIGIAGLLFKGH